MAVNKQNYSRYVLVHALEPLGHNEFTQWPLHITLVPWFAWPSTLAELEMVLQTGTRSMKHIVVVIERYAHFNPRTPVYLLRKTVALERLHQNLLEAITNNGGILAKNKFTQNAYTPHITVRRGQQFRLGSRIMIGSVSIVAEVSASPAIRKHKKTIRYETLVAGQSVTATQ